MIELKLETKSEEQELVKQYLEENVSQTLADKINNGIPTEKDGKPLISKKDLDGFFLYASEEAKKLADKSARSACVEDKTVYGWAIHYFEEDSIIGNLYYMDGAEYKPPVKAKTATTKTITPTVVKKEEKPQMSFFDLGMTIEDDKKPNNEEPEKYVDEETDEILTEEEMREFDGDVDETIPQIVVEKPIIKSNPVGTPMYQKFLEYQQSYPNAIVVNRLGDFYEFLGQNATIVAEELDLTLTGRDCGLESRVPMCGVPYHAVDRYLTKLLKNHNLAIVESDTDIQYLEQLPKDHLEPSKSAPKALLDLFGQVIKVR